MSEFFKPFRRKAGCVTLGLACVFLVGWVRSFYIIEHAYGAFSLHEGRISVGLV